MKLELSDGQWASMRDVATITNRERRAVMRTWAGTDADDFARGMVFVDGLIGLFVEEWSLPLALPGTDPAVLDDLTAHDYDRLAGWVNRQKLFLDTSPDPDPASPTVPSSG